MRQSPLLLVPLITVHYTRWFLKGIALLTFGCLLHFSEVYLLCSVYATNLHQDYVIGTYFMGVGAAIAALSNSTYLKNDILSKVGKFTLGIYVIHLAFVDILRPIGKLTSSWFWEIGYIMLVLFFSVI